MKKLNLWMGLTISTLIVSFLAGIGTILAPKTEQIKQINPPPQQEVAIPKPMSIEAPMAGHAPKFKIFHLKAGKQQQVVYKKSGTKINIPADAFVNEKGRLVKGKVELKYREFQDPITTLMAGVPMQYDTAGARRDFESAGMMEIRAYQKGKEIFVNPESKIKVELASYTEDRKYNLYYFDEDQGNWTYHGKDEPKLYSEPIKVDTEEKLDGVNFKYFFDGSKKKKERFGFNNLKEYRPGKKFKHPVTRSFKFHDLSTRQKEMKVFDGIVWNYSSGAQKTDVKSFERIMSMDSEDGRYIYRYWDFVFVKYLPNTDYFTFVFKCDNCAHDDISVNLYPTFEDEFCSASLSDLYASYKEVRDEKRDEKFLSFNKNQERRNRNFIMRGFVLDGFGIWNCDYVIPYRAYSKVKIRLLDKEGKEFNPAKAMTLNSKFNTVLPVGDQRIAKLIPDHQNILIAFTKDDKIFYLLPEDFGALEENKRIAREFTLREVKDYAKIPELMDKFRRVLAEG